MGKKKIQILDSKEGYDLAAPHYDKKEKYLNSFEDGRVLDILGSLENKKVLDVGAGTGRLAVLLSKAGGFVTALDVSEKMLEILKRKSRKIEVIFGDAEYLSFEDESFDVVVGAFLIVHLKNPSIFFKEAYRVLKPGGVLLITNINQKEPPEVETKTGNIKIESYYHNPENLIEKLEELAFEVEEKIVSTSEVWVNQILKCIK